MEIGLVIGLLALAIVLFATEKISVDIVTIFLLIILVLTGIITTKEAFAAFSSDFIIMLASIFVITAAIERSGVMDLLSEYISRTKTAQALGVVFWMMPFTAFLSAFMNNTSLTALLIPPLLSIAKRSGVSASKLLMPMAFANIVGGTCTIIGTSTNIAVNGYLAEHGFDTLNLFDIAPIGLVMLACFMVYMLTIGRLLLPDRVTEKLTDSFKVREYMSEVKVLENSILIGQNVFHSTLANTGFSILGIIRGNRKFYPGRNSTFKEDDLVLVKGNIESLISLKAKNGIDIMADTLEVFYDEDEESVNHDPIRLVEVLIPGNSELVGKTVKSSDFRNRYGLVVVAIHRAGKRFSQKIGSTTLQVGDVLLVQGPAEKISDFHDQQNLVFLKEQALNPSRVKKGFMAIGLFIVAILLSSFDILSLEIAFLSAALGTVLLNITTPEEAYHHINWKMLVLIAGMSAFATAMTNSGADVFISQHFISLFDGLGPMGIMAGFMIITVLLTQPMSNAAAALVVLPVAMTTAQSMNVNPVTFAVAIMLSASISIITPFEPSCILIYAPGKYRFFDFIKVGGLLTLILMAVIFFMVPMFWPLHP